MRTTISAAVVFTIAATLCVSTAIAQNQGGGNQGGGNQGGGNQGGGNQGGGQGQGNQPPGGILISPDGVVAGAEVSRQPARLQQKRLQALAQQHLSADMNRPSELRKVSLVRLEEECRRALEAGEDLSPEIRFLAGLNRIDYVFLMPETRDLVIAGPAEGFATLDNMRVVGTESGRPTLTLEDLLVMLRLGSSQDTLGCSFDPDPGRLAQAQAYLQQNSNAVSMAVAKQRFAGVTQVLGPWDVSIFGVPASSHTATSFVEADYQLKRLALGLDSPRVRGFRSYLAMVTPNGNLLRRWWFAPRYNALETTPDETTFYLSGPRLQLMSQDELIGADGKRENAAFMEVSNEKFTRQFNEKMEELCSNVASLAVLQNQFDLAVASALIRQYRLAERINWSPDLLLDEQRLPLTQYNVAEQVPSQVNARTASGQLMIGLIGGGISIVPASVVRRDLLVVRDDLSVPATVNDPTAWWWD